MHEYCELRLKLTGGLGRAGEGVLHHRGHLRPEVPGERLAGAQGGPARALFPHRLLLVPAGRATALAATIQLTAFGFGL